MKRYLALLLSVIVMLGLMSGCTKDDDDDNGTGPELTSFEKLTTYMTEQSLDLPDIEASWLIEASAVVGNEDTYFLVDIRSADVFTAGHIAGAHNVPLLADVVDYADVHNTELKPVVVICYTGQSAARGVVALRMNGYSDARNLKFGMSAWNASLDGWTANISSFAVGHSNWSTSAAPTPSFTEEPVITATATDGEGILAERVDYMLTKSDWGVSATDVVETPGIYSIINYWGATDYDFYGHISGAYQVTPGTLMIANDGLEVLDPVGTNVIYCWTGHSSSIITAWLDILGYDAKSLKFGANSMIYSELQKNTWTQSADYALVTGS